ncbi:hypothetical protein ACLK19_05970 [Escherichia coli]
MIDPTVGAYDEIVLLNRSIVGLAGCASSGWRRFFCGRGQAQQMAGFP